MFGPLITCGGPCSGISSHGIHVSLEYASCREVGGTSSNTSSVFGNELLEEPRKHAASLLFCDRWMACMATTLICSNGSKIPWLLRSLALLRMIKTNAGRLIDAIAVAVDGMEAVASYDLEADEWEMSLSYTL